MGEEAYSDEELEALRRRRMLELQRGAVDEQRRSQAQQQEKQKQSVLRQILTQEARQRLTNIRMVKPEFAEELEMQLIQLAQAGRLQNPVTDEQLKKTLQQMQGRRKDIKIRRA